MCKAKAVRIRSSVLGKCLVGIRSPAAHVKKKKDVGRQTCGTKGYIARVRLGVRRRQKLISMITQGVRGWNRGRDYCGGRRRLVALHFFCCQILAATLNCKILT